ncbi:M20/M25/M40 family metallo-hydrolase [Halorarum halophilum]|uniref:M20/M25/M40 family metallo-hydrolase n=1 Tax=Halorarum halophilum TaxID=2743090 RepID=A0A7D5K127_9EURY|nr:M20/M25/M40 family metallo-hydrolase [Halobaculum halophilum]QLG27421.1 M20/M25/M40 family metallo-hydrolase [Halobaculum halophilum]
MTELTDRELAVIERGCAWIDDNADELVDLLAELVARPSLPGDEGVHDDEATTVGQLWSFLEESADALELDAQPISAEDDYREKTRENVYAVLPGDGDDGFVATSHTDVVPPGPTADWPDDDPWTMREGVVRRTDDCTVEVAVGDRVETRTIRDRMDRVWRLRGDSEVAALVGRGVYDNKAAIVCLVGSALGLDAALAGTDATLGGDVIHGHLVDEEYYQVGAKNMVGWGGGGDWLGDRYDGYDGWTAAVLEGSYGFVPVVGHRGLVWLTLRAEGESAHASTPDLGHNAVLGAAKALAETDTDAYRDAVAAPFVEDALLGELTVAPGTSIVGGGIERVDPETGSVERGGLNTIPDWCEATFDVRIPRWEGFPGSVDAVEDRLCETVVAHASAAAPDVDFSASIGEHDFFPPVALADDREAAADHPLVRTASWAAADTVGYDPGLDVAPGVTDAAFVYHGTHIPTLVEYGPAGALSHEPLEYVERDHVIAGAKAMLKLAVAEVGVTQRS